MPSGSRSAAASSTAGHRVWHSGRVWTGHTPLGVIDMEFEAMNLDEIMREIVKMEREEAKSRNQ